MVPASLGRWRRTRELNAGSAQCGKMAMDLHGGDRPCARGADPRQYGKKNRRRSKSSTTRQARVFRIVCGDSIASFLVSLMLWIDHPVGISASEFMKSELKSIGSR
jgi:hypothetical protein